MKILLIYCHPMEESFTAAVRDIAIATLSASGHQVTVADLYREGFDPVMGYEERKRYHDAGDNEMPVAAELARLKAAEALIFVFPTWWYGLPAVLKGWLDRVWVPHATFILPDGPGPIRPGMTNIQLIGGITSCGSPWWWMKWVGEPGKRTLLSGIRPLCAPRCRRFWLVHHRMDASTPDSRQRFLNRVEKRLKTV